MSKKLKGFSLAELLISLLIISIVLSAAIPTLTKKSGADRENIWRWAREGNNAYFGTGSNQSAIIGLDTIPRQNTGIADILEDEEATTESVSEGDIGTVNLAGVSFSNWGDKLILLKKNVQNSSSNFMNSHISFYTLGNSADASATVDDIKYAGRLTMDSSNIALGMGTLQNIESDGGENTAIGHFALLRDTEGYRNTAVGKKSLSYNESGSYNTAIGFASLFELGRKEEGASESTGDDSEDGEQNTAIGALAQQYKQTGANNTAIGAQALRGNITGNNNTAIGQRALAVLGAGNHNTSIGTNSCSGLTTGSYNVCIGYNVSTKSLDKEEDNYGLYIGTGTEESDGVPLITGHMVKNDADEKALSINAREVLFRTFDGTRSIFRFESNKGLDGYGSDFNAHGFSGLAEFNLRDAGSAGNGSVSLTFRAANKDARIFAYDKYDGTTSDISFNDLLRFNFPTSSDTLKKVNILAQYGESGPKYKLSLNNKLIIENEDNAPFVAISKDAGFIIQKNETPGSSEFFSVKDNIMTISDATGSKKITMDPEQISYKKGNDDTVRVNEHGITIGNNAYIQLGDNNSDINLPKLKTDTKFATEVINKHEDRIKSLEDKLNNLGIPSDERLKNISGDNTAGLKEINALEVKNYTYKDDKEKIPHVGVIAQQLQKVFPNSVFKDNDGFFRIRTEEIFYAMVNSIKELCVKIQDLTAKVTGLDKRITALEKQNKMLLEQNKAFEKRLQKLEHNSK